MKSHEPTTSYKVNHFTSHWFDTKRYKTVYLRTTKKNNNTMKHC